MLLAIDAGNTNVVFGLFDSDLAPPASIWRLASRRDRTADEWFALLAPLLGSFVTTVENVVISTVVPSIGDALSQTMSSHLAIKPLVVNVNLNLGIRVRTDVPHETGTDRVVNCAAAFARFGGPTIVVDLGTATKIEALTDTGDFLGGTISPGLGLSLESLANRAARLYAVPLQRPSTVIGRQTVSAVQAGIAEGHLAMIEGIVARMKQELGGTRHVVLTGGFAPIYAETVKTTDSIFTDYVPDLTLDGLRLIYLRNRR